MSAHASPGACRACGAAALEPFLDLGSQPLAGWFPGPADPVPDPSWPLRPAVCQRCWLVQLADDSPDEFELPDAPPPTSSRTMAAHARGFVADLVQRGLAGPGRTILEVASHGGHLRPFFAEADIASTVIERPSPRAARLIAEGAQVIQADLDEAADSAAVQALGPVDLFVDHYLLAHLSGPEAPLRTIASLLAPEGAAVLEFDHLLPTIQGRQVDAFRHGHRSYLSLTWLHEALARHGLMAVDAVQLPVYGGALRVFVRRAGTRSDGAPSVASVLASEAAAGLDRLPAYRDFAAAAAASREETVALLRARAAIGRPVLGYGAPARGVTLANWYGLGQDLVPFTADASPAKQGRYVPGVRLPIRAPSDLLAARPAEILIFTWDIVAEIAQQLEEVQAWGGRLLVPIPRLTQVVG